MAKRKGMMRLLVAVAVLEIGSGGVRAQMDNGLPGPQPIDMGSVILSNTLLKINLDNSLGTSGNSGTAKKAKGLHAAQPSVSTSYHSSPGVTERVEKQYIAWLAKSDPKGAEQLRTVFARQNPVALWSRSVHEDGLHIGDVADSLAAYWILNWIIANRGDNNRSQAQAVRKQVHPLIASSPAYARLTNAQRQEMSEVLMVNFVVQLSVYSDAVKRNDTALLAKLGDAATARFRNEMGVNLREMKLTDHGFAKKI